MVPWLRTTTPLMAVVCGEKPPDPCRPLQTGDVHDFKVIVPKARFYYSAISLSQSRNWSHTCAVKVVFSFAKLRTWLQLCEIALHSPIEFNCQKISLNQKHAQILESISRSTWTAHNTIWLLKLDEDFSARAGVMVFLKKSNHPLARGKCIKVNCILLPIVAINRRDCNVDAWLWTGLFRAQVAQYWSRLCMDNNLQVFLSDNKDVKNSEYITRCWIPRSQLLT